MGRTFKLATLGIVTLLMALALISGAAAMTVPLFGQCWSPWSGNQLGTCSETVCSAGCAISSTAMVFKYHGVNTDPGAINNWLTNNGGYESGCLLCWDIAPGCSGGLVSYAGYIDYSNIPADMNVINAEIDAGYPVVAEVRLSGGMHFVVITGRSGSTYNINDPAYGDQTTLNARYGDPATAIYGINKYRGSSSVIIDNTSSKFSCSANWATGTGTGKYGADYRWRSTQAISDPATWTPGLTGNYAVYAWWPAGGNRSTAAPYKVTYNGGTATVTVNQQINGGQWNYLGTWNFASTSKVQLSCWATTGFVVCADALKFVVQ